MDTCRVCNRQSLNGSLCEDCACVIDLPIDPEAKCAVCDQFLRGGDDFCYKVMGFREMWRVGDDGSCLTPNYKVVHLECSRLASRTARRLKEMKPSKSD